MYEELLDKLTAFAGEQDWVVQVFLLVLLTAIVALIQRIAVKRLAKKVRDTRNVWDDSVIGALQGPLGGLIWVIGVSWAAEIIRVKTEAPIFVAIGPMREVGIVAVFTWFLVRLIRLTRVNYVEQKKAQGEKVDVGAIYAVAKLTRVAVIVTAALVMLQTLGFSVSGVLAFGGVGGIAIGFAARDLLANLFGGLTVYLDRPFSVGDWIRSPDREIEGTVEEIGWRTSRIRTFDKRPLYVPNSVFTTIAVENPSRMSHRRIKETIGVRYDDVSVLPEILRGIRDMLHEHPEIDQSQTLMVHLNEFGESSVDFFIYTFTRTTVWTRFHEVKEDVLLRIAAIVDGHGAEIAFPTRTVHLQGEGLANAEGAAA